MSIVGIFVVVVVVVFDCLFLLIGLYKIFFYGSQLNYNYFCYQFLLMNYENMKRGKLSFRVVCGSVFTLLILFKSYDLIFYFFLTLSIEKLRKNVLNFPTNDVFLFDHHCIFHSFVVYTLMLLFSSQVLWLCYWIFYVYSDTHFCVCSQRVWFSV